MMRKKSGPKSMHQNSPETKLENYTRLKEEVLSTLAFFALYELPLSPQRVHELVGYHATLEEVQHMLVSLAADEKIIQVGNLYSLKPWKAQDYRDKQIEISKKWRKIDRYHSWLAIIPYVNLVAVINSLAMGTADGDSDIDFFVITKNNRLYFVRSMIIVLFRILGLYKTKHKIKDKFCFGFFVTKNSLNLEHLLIKPADPYFIYWMANMRPITDGKQYWELMQQNAWLTHKLPNFEPINRQATVKKPNFLIRTLKLILEILLWLPSFVAEPVLRRIHINHTFKLAENRAVTSTTIANERMLKLHAYDVRAQIASAHKEILQNLG
jgi:hypothetical protein